MLRLDRVLLFILVLDSDLGVERTRSLFLLVDRTSDELDGVRLLRTRSVLLSGRTSLSDLLSGATLGVDLGLLTRVSF